MSNQNQDISKMKKQNSYTYWVKKQNQNQTVKIDCTPQKLQSPLIQNQNQSKNQPSKWNTSGTWQQRKIKISDLQQKLNGIFKKLCSKNRKLEVQSLSVNGEGNIIFSRGKKSVSYDFKITIKFIGLQEYDQIKGSVRFEEFNDQGERDYGIKLQGQKKEEINKQLKEQIPNWIKIIEKEISVYKQ